MLAHDGVSGCAEPATFRPGSGDGADGDARIGDVEGREMAAMEHTAEKRPVEVQKVDHIAVHHAVDHVADGAAQDAGQRKGEQLLTAVRAQHPDDEHRRGHADAGEHPALPAACIGQEREGRAGVVGPHDVEEPGDKGAVAQLVVLQNPESW